MNHQTGVTKATNQQWLKFLFSTSLKIQSFHFCVYIWTQNKWWRYYWWHHNYLMKLCVLKSLRFKLCFGIRQSVGQFTRTHTHIHTGVHTSKTTPTHMYTRHVTITSSPPWIIHQVQRWQTAIRSNLPTNKKQSTQVSVPSNTDTNWLKHLCLPRRLRRDETRRNEAAAAVLDAFYCGWASTDNTLLSFYLDKLYSVNTDFRKRLIHFWIIIYYIVIFPPCRCQM